MTEQPLAGKTALVTGSARNIGRATVHRLADLGADIVVNAVGDLQAAETVAAEIRDKGRKSIACLADITDPGSVQEMVARAKTELGGVDILVLNASSRGQVPFLELDYETFRRVIDISVDGAFHCAQACLPHMQKKGWGRIVTLGGIAWHVGMKDRVHSLISKSALAGFTHGLAAEFAEDGVTVNCVSPGFIETARPASAGQLPQTKIDAFIPRKGTPEEVASMVCYLCLPESGYITGQIMHVNGGMYLGGS